MVLGTLAAIWRYPVKSLGGESLASVAVDATGIPGDRSSALFVTSRHARAGKTYRGKEHERLHLTGSVTTAFELAAARGVELEQRSRARFFDDAPISILVDRWMTEMNASLGYDVEPERFRANFFVRASEDVVRETALVGARLSLGEVRLRVRGPIERCVAVTYDPSGKASDPNILRFIARCRNACMGIYCDVDVTGRVHLGDALVSTRAQ